MELGAPGSLFLLYPQHAGYRKQERKRVECGHWPELLCAIAVNHFHQQMASGNDVPKYLWQGKEMSFPHSTYKVETGIR